MFILFLMGCYNYKELNDLAIVSGMEISYDGNNFDVMLEIVNPKKKYDDDKDFIIYHNSGSSIQGAINKISLEVSKELYLNHLNLLIIDESAAGKKLSSVLDYLGRDYDIRGEFYVLIGKSKSFILENISSDDILGNLKSNSNYLGYTNKITYHDFIDCYLNPYREITSGSIEYNNDNIKIGIGIFKNNTFIRYLDENDALVYNLINGNIDNFFVDVMYQKHEYVVNEILHENTSLSVAKNKITINIDGNALMVENVTSFDLNNMHVFDDLERDMNQTLEKMVMDSVLKIINEYNIDIYGFKNLLYKKYPNINNDSFLDDIEIDVKANVKLSGKGNLNGGLYYE